MAERSGQVQSTNTMVALTAMSRKGEVTRGRAERSEHRRLLQLVVTPSLNVILVPLEKLKLLNL